MNPDRAASARIWDFDPHQGHVPNDDSSYAYRDRKIWTLRAEWQTCEKLILGAAKLPVAPQHQDFAFSLCRKFMVNEGRQHLADRNAVSCGRPREKMGHGERQCVNELRMARKDGLVGGTKAWRMSPMDDEATARRSQGSGPSTRANWLIRTLGLRARTRSGECRDRREQPSAPRSIHRQAERAPHLLDQKDAFVRGRAGSVLAWGALASTAGHRPSAERQDNDLLAVPGLKDCLTDGISRRP